MSLTAEKERLKNKDTGTYSKKERLLLDCFEYGIFKEHPSKKYRTDFEETYETTYPDALDDMTPALQKELRQTVTIKKEMRKEKEKVKRQRTERGFADSDCWNIYAWFLEMIPQMLTQLRNNLHGYPAKLMPPKKAKGAASPDETKAGEEAGQKQWEAILDRMIFLLREMNEDTCSFQNPYETEFLAMEEDFRKKYGFGGERLQSEEEKQQKSHRMYFPWEFPDLYPNAIKLHHNFLMQEQLKNKYRDQCREEFFQLFSLHFWDLWD